LEKKNIKQKKIKMSKKSVPIIAIDIFNNQVVKVENGVVVKVIASDVEEYCELISVNSRFLFTDLNRVFNEKDLCNVELIKKLLKKYSCYVAGGIRDVNSINEYLNNSARRCYLGTAAYKILSENNNKIKGERLCFAIDLKFKSNNDDDYFENKFNINDAVVLIKGRKEEVDFNLLDIVNKYYFDNLMICFTFHDLEGTNIKVSKRMIDEINLLFKNKKVAIAGGKWDREILKYCCDKNIIPQIGNSYHTGAITNFDILYASLDLNVINYPIIIKDVDGNSLGIIHGNLETIQKSIETRDLVSYSTKDNIVRIKGDNSGNKFKLLKYDITCEGRGLVFIVEALDENKSNFCHCGDKTCFTMDTNYDISKLLKIVRENSNKKDSYIYKLLKNPSLNMCKIFEEFEELISAFNTNNKDKITGEFCDLLFHIIPLLSKFGITSQDISDEYRKRHYITSKEPKIKFERDPTKIYLGVCKGHQNDAALKFINSLGFTSNKNVEIIQLKPKDIAKNLLYELFDFIICYNDSLSNYMINESKEICRLAVDKEYPNIKICLVAKKERLDKFTSIDECIKSLRNTVTEYRTVTDINFDKDPKLKHIAISTLTGSSEELVEKCLFDSCVVIVESGSTLKKHNLVILKELIWDNPLALFTTYEYLFNNNKDIVLDVLSKNFKYVDGNDGSGKSTFIKTLNKLNNTVQLTDRSILTKLTDYKYSEHPEKIDDNILLMITDSNLCYARKKSEKDPYHTLEAINYYSWKYLYLMFRYNVTYINSSNFTFGKIMKLDDVNDEKFNFDKYELIAEGCSKIIRNLGDGFHVIKYKPTIHSHKSGKAEIVNGSEYARMVASRAFLEILKRNGVNHSAIYYNPKKNILVSKAIDNSQIPQIEVIVKACWNGSDKHKYPNLLKSESVHKLLCVNEDLTKYLWYKTPQVRFDFRAPNFDNDGNRLGDSIIYGDILNEMINVEKTKELVLKAFNVISEFLRNLGLILVDICFMVTKSGDMLFYEISPDCFRVSIADWANINTNGNIKINLQSDAIIELDNMEELIDSLPKTIPKKELKEFTLDLLEKYTKSSYFDQIKDSTKSLDKDVFRSGNSLEVVLQKWCYIALIANIGVEKLNKFVQ